LIYVYLFKSWLKHGVSFSIIFSKADLLHACAVCGISSKNENFYVI
jgi:hypothetical protein